MDGQQENQIALKKKLIDTRELQQFSTELLGYIKQAIQSIIVVQLGKAQLKKTLGSNYLRKKVIHSVISVGDALSFDALATSKEEWEQIREAFISLLE